MNNALTNTKPRPRKYRVSKGDYVQDQLGRKGMAMTVGAVGGQVEALVAWADDRSFEYVPIDRLKRTFRVVEDPDT
jgi:hypothetical protein